MNSEQEINAAFEEWFVVRHRRLTKEDRENPAFRNLSRLAFEAGIDFAKSLPIRTDLNRF